MTSAIAPHVVFEIPGVPPSPNRTRYTREDPDVLAYRDLTIFHARGAKNRAHWRNDGEPAPRWLFIVLQRHALLDPDHAWASITPVLNGMKGSLLYDDTDGEHGGLCHLIRVSQQKIPFADRERTVITVWPVDPRDVTR